MEPAQLKLIAQLKSENEQLRLQNDGLRLKETALDHLGGGGHPTSDTGPPPYHNHLHPSSLDGSDIAKHPPAHHHLQQWHHPHHHGGGDESSKPNKDHHHHRGGGGGGGSPVNFQTFIVNSMHGAPPRAGGGGGGGGGGGSGAAHPDFDEEDCNNTKRVGAAAVTAATVKHPQRLLGEIAFQLEQRILAYVFQGQVTFYGFTVLNVKEKIVQVATRPFTGMLDEGYQRHLTGRHAELMDKLGAKAGYNPCSHPMFAQFIINSYGRLGCGETHDLAEPEVVRTALANVAPQYVLRDMLVLLGALIYMASKDGKPLFLW